MSRTLIKASGWLIALLGLWESADILAVLVPGFGAIPAFVWNHIVVGLILIVVGVWASLTSAARTAIRMDYIAVAAGLWLVVASFVLGNPVNNAGLWNDVIVGALASILGAAAALYHGSRPA
jgi:hypothetical protein